jgi:L-asparaginase II
MVAHPEMVAGSGRFCTDFLRALGGRMATKTGAEGLQCVAVPGRDLGIVVRAIDGAQRAVPPALVGWLHALGLVDAGEVEALGVHTAPALTNARDIVVSTLAAGSFPDWRPEAAATGAAPSATGRAAR